MKYQIKTKKSFVSEKCKINLFGKIVLIIFAFMVEEKETLSDTEKQWIRLLAAGNSTTDVAGMVGLSAGTFAYKMNLLRAKFRCKNMAALMAYLYKNQLVD